MQHARQFSGLRGGLLGGWGLYCRCRGRLAGGAQHARQFSGLRSGRRRGWGLYCRWRGWLAGGAQHARQFSGLGLGRGCHGCRGCGGGCTAGAAAGWPAARSMRVSSPASASAGAEVGFSAGVAAFGGAAACIIRVNSPGSGRAGRRGGRRGLMGERGQSQRRRGLFIGRFWQATGRCRLFHRLEKPREFSRLRGRRSAGRDGLRGRLFFGWNLPLPAARRALGLSRQGRRPWPRTATPGV